jgi:hypothetical protein
VNQFVEAGLALNNLQNLPLLDIGAAGTLLWIHFGQEITITDHRARIRTVGSWAVHIQCPWRISGRHGIVVASGDFWDPPVLDDEERNELFEARKDRSRFDVQIKHFLSDAQGVLIKKCAVDPCGGFRLLTERSYTIEVFPINSQEIECWRMFRPNSDNHFVVTGIGTSGSID